MDQGEFSFDAAVARIPDDIGLLPIVLEPGDRCFKCQSNEGIVATYVPGRPSTGKAAHIVAYCTRDGYRWELSKSRYANRFPELAGRPISKSKGKSRSSKRYDVDEHDLFAKFGWVCVYCEGSRRAAEYRLTQIRKLAEDGVVNPSGGDASGDGSEPRSLVVGASAIIGRADKTLQNLFGLVPDHMFSRWYQELGDVKWEDGSRPKAEREWVVSACVACNSRRNNRLESPDRLLFLYSVFLVPAMKLDGVDLIRDATLFVCVLNEMEAYQARVVASRTGT